MKDIFTGYIDIYGKHVVGGIKDRPTKGILVSDGNPDWKKRKFYEKLTPELGEPRTITVGRERMVVFSYKTIEINGV